MSATMELVEKTTMVIEGLSLTAAAAVEVKNIIGKNKIPDGYTLRVGVSGGGCSGLSYALGFDTKKEGDETFVSNGIEVLVDKKHLLYLAGTKVDYTDGLQGRGFTFNNPNATKSCGCGSSFSA